MENITIYHNPRCSKSRQTLAILKEHKLSIKVKEYLKEIPTKEELEGLINKLGISPDELIRKGEKDWKQNFAEKKMSHADLIDAMLLYPKLIERPIVVKGEQAIIGRPPERVLDLL